MCIRDRYELVHNSRIAGGINPASAEKIAELYASFVEGEIYPCDARTAELCKLTENTFRDVNIAFANELTQICENLGIDVWQVIQLCNKHPREMCIRDSINSSPKGKNKSKSVWLPLSLFR